MDRKIVNVDRGKEAFDIKSWIESQDGEVVIQGRAVAGLLRGMKE